MISSITAWLLAHLISDFVFQTNAMVQNKRKLPTLLAHGAIVFLITLLLIGGHWQSAVVISLTHIIIDAIKIRIKINSWIGFALDQLAHLAVIACVAIAWPNSWGLGAWGQTPLFVIKAAVILCAIIACANMGGYLVGMIMKPFEGAVKSDDNDVGLENAGRLIGQLERLMILLMVLVGQSAGVGLLIAAKSILRFDTVKKSRAMSEYIIIGTLASFAWAMVLAYITQYTLALSVLNP